MERESMKQKIVAMICEITEGDEAEITEESKLMDDLELSSLEIMTMIAEVEREFRITLDETDIRNVISLGDLMACIEEKIQGNDN